MNKYFFFRNTTTNLTKNTSDNQDTEESENEEVSRVLIISLRVFCFLPVVDSNQPYGLHNILKIYLCIIKISSISNCEITL